jgi:hypothetical protein
MASHLGQKIFQKITVFQKWHGGGVNKAAVILEPGDQFTDRLKFWKLDNKVAGLELMIAGF